MFRRAGRTGCLRVAVCPFAVEGFSPLLIRALKSMASEKVPLRLCQVCRHSLPAVAVKVCERRGHGRACDSRCNAESDNPAPGGLPRVDLVGEILVDEQGR